MAAYAAVDGADKRLTVQFGEGYSPASERIGGSNAKTLLSATLGTALGYPNVCVVAFGSFSVLFIETFGWSHVQSGLAWSSMALGAVVGAPVAGMCADRFGVRATAFWSMLCLASCFLALSIAGRSPLTYFLLYALAGLLGAGTQPSTYLRAIVDTFRERRGFAIGLVLSGVGVFAAAVPRLLAMATAYAGVTGGYLALAGIVLAALGPVGLLSPNLRRVETDPRSMRDRWQALLDCTTELAFQKLAAAGLIMGLFTGAVWGGMLGLLIDHGIARDTAVSTMSALAISLTLVRILTGYLLDKMFAPYLASLMLFPSAIGLLMLASGESEALAILGAIFIGAGIGAEFDILAYLVGRYLPSQDFGSIFGTVYGVSTVGACVGPVAIGYFYDTTGTYFWSLATLAAALVLAIALLLRLGPYPDQST